MAPWFSASAVSGTLTHLWSLSPTGSAWLTVSVQLGFVTGAFISSALALSDLWSARRLFAWSTAAAAITTALIGASEVPLETARACAAVAALAELVAAKGNPSAVSDAGVSPLLADAACRGASYNVRINVAALSDASKGHALIDAAKEFVRETSTAAARVSAEVERHI